MTDESKRPTKSTDRNNVSVFPWTKTKCSAPIDNPIPMRNTETVYGGKYFPRCTLDRQNERTYPTIKEKNTKQTENAVTSNFNVFPMVDTSIINTYNDDYHVAPHNMPDCQNPKAT